MECLCPPKERKCLSNWEVLMPKCCKSFAKWEMLAPNCCTDHVIERPLADSFKLLQANDQCWFQAAANACKMKGVRSKNAANSQGNRPQTRNNKKPRTTKLSKAEPLNFVVTILSRGFLNFQKCGRCPVAKQGNMSHNKPEQAGLTDKIESLTRHWSWLGVSNGLQICIFWRWKCCKNKGSLWNMFL